MRGSVKANQSRMAYFRPHSIGVNVYISLTLFSSRGFSVSVDLIYQAYTRLNFSHTIPPTPICHNFVCDTSEKTTTTADHH